MDGGEGRIGLLAALGFAVLYLLSGLVVPSLPNPDASPAEVQRYFVNNEGALATSAWLAVAATVPYLVFVSVLRRRIAAARGWLGDLAFAGGLLLAASGALAVSITVGLALHPDFNPPETVRMFVDVERFYAPLATAAVFTLAGAVALGALRHDALPRWAGAVSLVYCLYEVCESFTVFGGDTGGFAPGQSVNLVGTLGALVWAILIGASMSRPYPRVNAPEGHGQAG